MPADFNPWLIHLPAWLLVLFRITGIFLFAPVLSSASIPGRVKVFLAVGISLCVYPMLVGGGAATGGAGGSALALVGEAQRGGLSLWMLPVAVANELLVGFALGFGAALPMLGMQVAGHIADQQLGFGFGGIFNPDLDEELGVMGQLFAMSALAIYAAWGGHRLLLATLVGSFGHVPLGGFEASGDAVRLLLGLLTSSFELALKVSAPLLCLVFLESAAMGFLARTAPQMNILSVGFALRILVGGAVVIGGLAAGFGAYAAALQRTLGELAGFFVG